MIAVGAVAVTAVAIGAVGVGAIAVGAIAVGAVAVGAKTASGNIGPYQKSFVMEIVVDIVHFIAAIHIICQCY